MGSHFVLDAKAGTLCRRPISSDKLLQFPQDLFRGELLGVFVLHRMSTPFGIESGSRIQQDLAVVAFFLRLIKGQSLKTTYRNRSCKCDYDRSSWLTRLQKTPIHYRNRLPLREVIVGDHSDSCRSSSRSESGLAKASSTAAIDALSVADRELVDCAAYIDETATPVPVAKPPKLVSRVRSNRRASSKSRLSNEPIPKEPPFSNTL